MKRPTSLTIGIILLLPLPAAADQHSHDPRLTPVCEEALALSALPEKLRSDASVYTLTPDGYALTRKGDGPFTCIIERNHENAIIPQCPDAAGADTVIPGIIKRSEWALDGLSVAERQDRFQTLVDNGNIRAPSRPGISYMMSDFTYVWNAQRGGLLRVPPHVMFYAPNLTNDEIGGSLDEGLGRNRGYPFIVQEGVHGYITTFVEIASDSAAVNAACEGQIPPAPPTLGEPAQSAG